MRSVTSVQIGAATRAALGYMKINLFHIAQGSFLMNVNHAFGCVCLVGW